MLKTETLLSTNQKTILTLRQFLPERSPCAILQVCHGMSEYFLRFRPLCDYLNARGVLVCGIDHAGHGEGTPEKELGHVPGGKNLSVLVEDQKLVYDTMRKTYRHLPYVLLGHSMGSFVARKVLMEYPDAFDGAILSGTRADTSRLGLGMALTALIGLFCGKKHKGKLVSGLAFRHFNDRYGKPYAFDWICADPAVVSEYTADPLCGFAFSVSAYRQMFGLLRQINSPEWEEKLPLSLPILICGGDGDPVGNYGKDLQTLYDRLSERDFSDLRLHIYEGARHELHNDLCREQVFAEWSDFISGVVEGVNAARTMNGGFTL